MNTARPFFDSFGSHKALKNYRESNPSRLTGIPNSAFSSFFCDLLQNTAFHRNYLLIFPSEKEARQVFHELECFWDSLPEAKETKQNVSLLFFPTWGLLPYSYARPDPEKEGQRAGTLSRLSCGLGEGVVVVTSPNALLIRTPLPEEFKNGQILLKEDTDVPMQKLYGFLTDQGYERVEIVEKQGQYSSKGGILDIFCPAHFNPIRLDFFGDTIESLRFFDPLSQSSLERVSELLISPRRDLPLKQTIIENILASPEYQKAWQGEEASAQEPPFAARNGAGLSQSTDKASTDGFWDFYPLGLKTSCLLDYFHEPPVCIWNDQKRILLKVDLFFEEQNIFFERSRNRLRLEPFRLFLSPDEFQDRFLRKNDLDEIQVLPTPEKKDDLSLGLQEATQFKGRISGWIGHLQELFRQKQNVFLSTSSPAQKERIEHILSAYDIKSPHPYLHFLDIALAQGFIWDQGVLFTEKEIFGRQVKAARRISKSSTEAIQSFVDLNEGDHVVHVSYGIGKFTGLKRIPIRGFERDFLELIYAGGDKLFVPLEQLNSVHRYIGSTENPTLDYLGKSSSWQKTKEKVREAIEKLAEELLELYAKREKSKGVAFPQDSAFQEEFEAAFVYEETEDQISAVTDIKKDMESERPMDRLICGDVGYGKTEVAIRAVFKVVMAGKQVAVLCPTTILAFQHFRTFTERFQAYPVSIDFISRFKTQSEIKTAKEAIKNGAIDVVIGTHALLNKDIVYKNLGLLVVDEEQKFGVVHKEVIRKMRTNVDTITLTATPIPRTLQMSLVGIRDLSLIEVPPRNRKKVETHVLAEDEELLKEAIAQEIKRDGQVYLLHNRVKTIETEAKKIRNLCPRARLGVLHGQMPEDLIEEVMLNFYKKHYDILLCTTIIESGIDIPNVNTLIVLNAHTFGLSQLYQLKGRVGRSERQAYAYFFYPAQMSLTEVASQRLNTLQEYDELGAGFKIAMKDLEIRGAGNILGKEQSGDIMAVGFELYVQMLREKLNALEFSLEDSETSIVIPQSFFIPDEYIPDTRQKMEFYKKMASAMSTHALAEVQAQLKDRFGELPTQMLNLIRTEEVRILANERKLDKLKWDREKFILTASPKTKISMDAFARLIKNDERISLDPTAPKVTLFTPRNKETGQALLEVKEFLTML